MTYNEDITHRIPLQEEKARGRFRWKNDKYFDTLIDTPKVSMHDLEGSKNGMIYYIELKERMKPAYTMENLSGSTLMEGKKLDYFISNECTQCK